MVARVRIPQVTAWSYSRYACYAGCAAQFMYKHLMKLPDPPGPAAARGNAVHANAENFIKAKVDLPVELGGLKEQANFLKENFATAEQPWGFRKDWSWTGKPNWFGDDVWFRLKADVVLAYDDDTGLVGDWKTGKKYDNHADQAELSAVAALMRYPAWTEADVRFWYADLPPAENEEQWVFTRAESEQLKKKWERKVRPMFSDRKFAPTPSWRCAHCAYSKAKDGPCRF